MDKADLTALLDAHGGRAQPVASLHVLRASVLGADEHAFLTEHQAELATIDLSRWLGLARPEQRPAVLDALAAFAEREPARFEAEIARAPHFQLEPAEREHLGGRLRGRVPDTLIAALSGEAAPAAPIDGALGAPADGEMFDPGDLLGDVDFGSDGGGFGAGEGAARGGGSSGDARPAAGEDGLGDLLGDMDLFDSGDGGLAGDAGSAGAGFFGGGPSAPPGLGELLGELSGLNTARAKTKWKARARALAADAGEDWSRAVTLLPPEMADAVAHRAASSPRADERATLLEWLLQNEARKAKLVELTVAFTALSPKVESASQWLAQSFLPRVLADKATWQKHGPEVLGALAEHRCFGEMDQLFTSALTGAGALGPGLLSLPGGPAALRAPVFAAFSTMLLARTGAAVGGKDGKSAQAYAAALASIGFPARKAAEVASLRRKRGAKGDVARLLGVARARKPKDVPQLEDFIAAVHVLSDAL